jgi:hypothetical protein
LFAVERTITERDLQILGNSRSTSKSAAIKRWWNSAANDNNLFKVINNKMS